MRILSLCTSDGGGGAEQIALDLIRAARAKGHDVDVVVGQRRGSEPGVRVLSEAASRRARFVGRVRNRIDRALGIEPMGFPGTWALVNRASSLDVVHAHNLHGDWFDLRALPRLSARVPVVVTLHDAWLLAGHCAHSLDCDRWRTGCGRCPHLDTYPAIRRDASAANWRRKREIFAASRLHVVAPSQWMLDRAAASILAPAMATARVIHNGVDTTVFRPGERGERKSALGIDRDGLVVMFAANALRTNPFKDFDTMRAALAQLPARIDGRTVTCLAVGDDGRTERVGSVTLRMIPFVRDREELAALYRTADLYLHPTLADTFPSTVLEALASGLPVVGSAVGGLPEQVRDGETGWLVPPGDPAALAGRIVHLLESPAERHAIGDRAVSVARARFDAGRMVDDYQSLYAELAADAGRPRSRIATRM